MGKSTPEPPDPKETAAAQTGTNVTTALANTYMGNVNQVTPDGSLNYTYGKTQTIKDPTTGATYQVPITTATQTLSPAQQAIKTEKDRTSLNLGKLATSQSARLNDVLGTPFSLSGAPAAGSASSLTMPNYQKFSSGPQLQTSVGNTGTIANSIAGAGDITKTYGKDYSGNVKEVQDALMAKQQPYLDQDRAALETRLANQGIQIGTAAYDSAMNTYGSQLNDARYGAIINAGQEQSRLAGLDQAQAAFANSAQAQQYSQNANDAQFGNSAQQQAYAQAMGRAEFGNNASQQMFQNSNTTTAGNNALQDQGFNAQQSKINAQNTERANWMNEQYAQRNQPINEISSLLSGAQVSNPNFVSAQGQQMPTVDYAGLVNQNYQNQMAAYTAKQSQTNQILGGVMGLGSSLIMSDRRTKEDITKVGKVDGHNVYEFRYKHGGPMQLGVMAQEVEEDRPDAVREVGGIKHVNYGKLFNLGKAA